jgi:hypothetical protein
LLALLFLTMFVISTSLCMTSGFLHMVHLLRNIHVSWLCWSLVWHFIVHLLPRIWEYLFTAHVDDIVLTASSDSSSSHLHRNFSLVVLGWSVHVTATIHHCHSWNVLELPIVSHATLLLILTPRFLLLILHTTAVLLGPSSTLPSPDIIQCMTLENLMSTIKRIRSYLQGTLNYDLHLWSSTPFDLVVYRYSPLHFCYV